MTELRFYTPLHTIQKIDACTYCVYKVLVHTIFCVVLVVIVNQTQGAAKITEVVIPSST